jgi:uncharacterized membrane protein
MRITLLIHITAGGLAIVAGYAALYAAKGAGLHRRAGTVFVCAMVVMGLFGAWMAAFKAEPGNVIGGVMAAYMVTTALTTVRPSTAGTRRLNAAAMLVAVAAGLGSLALGFDSVSRGETVRNGGPVPVLFVLAAIALLSAVGDVRMMRSGAVRGAHRLARHLWRMCFALFVAAGSFFLGQADELPEPLRVFPVLMILSFLPLLGMLYWLWRVRGRRAPVRAAAPAADRVPLASRPGAVAAR